MANEQRLLILCHLAEGEKSVNELVSLVGGSQSAISQHLAQLRRNNLVTRRPESLRVYYSLSSPAFPIVLEAVQRVFAR
jgi:DNA-binding transcriptional ArsR family regulator